MADSMTQPSTVLLLPGWLDSDPGHWQSRWEAVHGYRRVEQADWLWPKRGDWMARLDEVLLDTSGPAVLVAHSLGCHLVAAWAAHSRHTQRVRGALLVAPPDIERDDVAPNTHSWRPVARRPLPFAGFAVISSDDPYCAADRAQQMAQDWGVAAVHVGPHGHINTESGLGDWPAGYALLQQLMREPG
jgi:predicted alpha/beta hydrolase family esterase